MRYNVANIIKLGIIQKLSGLNFLDEDISMVKCEILLFST